MKINLGYPLHGTHKTIDIDDERKLLPFFERRMGAEIAGDSLGDEYKGYVVRITGGNDRDGFPMKQGILESRRVRLLFKPGMRGYRAKKKGARQTKSVRGCIVGPDLSVLNLSIVKKGPAELPGITDKQIPRRLGPKRASKIRTLFGLSKADDVRKYVVRREVKNKKNGKAPKIQRLVTSTRIQRKKKTLANKNSQKILKTERRVEFKTFLTEQRKQIKQSIIST